jgi:hypothetical protein
MDYAVESKWMDGDDQENFEDLINSLHLKWSQWMMKTVDVRLDEQSGKR